MILLQTLLQFKSIENDINIHAICSQKYFAQSSIPVLIVATKSDLEDVRQDYVLQPDQFCAKYNLLPPQRFASGSKNIIGDSIKDVYVKLATMAAFP